jgi:hypothetical protein
MRKISYAADIGSRPSLTLGRRRPCRMSRDDPRYVEAFHRRRKVRRNPGVARGAEGIRTDGHRGRRDPTKSGISCACRLPFTPERRNPIERPQRRRLGRQYARAATGSHGRRGRPGECRASAPFLRASFRRFLSSLLTTRRGQTLPKWPCNRKRHQGPFRLLCLLGLLPATLWCATPSSRRR